MLTRKEGKEEQKSSDHWGQALPGRGRNSRCLMPNHHKLPMEGSVPLIKQRRRHLAGGHHRRRQIPTRSLGPNPKQHNLSPSQRSKMVILSMLAGLHKPIREGSHWRMIIITLPLFKYEDKEKAIAQQDNGKADEQHYQWPLPSCSRTASASIIKDVASASSHTQEYQDFHEDRRSWAASEGNRDHSKRILHDVPKHVRQGVAPAERLRKRNQWAEPPWRRKGNGRKGFQYRPQLEVLKEHREIRAHARGDREMGASTAKGSGIFEIKQGSIRRKAVLRQKLTEEIKFWKVLSRKFDELEYEFNVSSTLCRTKGPRTY